jgi:RNA recognition motif-containing protein
LNIYVGSISSHSTEKEVKKVFEAYGKISWIELIKDRHTDELRGFGYIEMPEETEAEAAIAGLNGKEFNGKKLTVNEARSHRNNFKGKGKRISEAASGFGRTSWLK